VQVELSGWGRTAPSSAEYVPLEVEAATALLARPPPRGVLARGLGRSYGDAAQNAGGVVLGGAAHAGLPEAVPASGVVRLPAGTSLDAVMRWALPQGWFVPVTPGTRMVTVGGAFAADIHGKNHHRDGAFSRHVTGLHLLTPAGGLHRLAPGDPLFDATAGGMGLTGIIVDVDLRLVPVETATMLVDTERVPDFDAMVTRLAELDRTHRYTVAWVDLWARGRSLGRGVITSGEHATVDDLGGGDAEGLRRFEPRTVLQAPPVPASVVNPLTVAAFNEVWFRRSPRRRLGEPQSIAAFFHPLDGVRAWNRVYGPRGLLQYQFAVPDDATDTVRAIAEDLAAHRAPTFLAVLKRFGPAGTGHLSFPAPGWTLAVDVPAGATGLADLLDRFDDRVVEAGGRVYLAKDSRLEARHLPAMYPRLDEWRAVRADADPDGVLRSDLDRRLGLTKEHHR
jgi:decaprenylphospho-beta-D-ribofuranose 2-oxidase